MLEHTAERFSLKPERLAGDSAYGSAEMLQWIIEQKIKPHVPVIDKSTRHGGTFLWADFNYHIETDTYTCPKGWDAKHQRHSCERGTARLYWVSTFDCGPCHFKGRCCPNTPARKIPRSIYEHAGGLYGHWLARRSPPGRVEAASVSRCCLRISSAS
jgi:hypothetical protein